MKRLKIKVCGLKYTDNIKTLDELDLDYLGFIFHENSPRNIGEPEALPDTITPKVGVFVNKSSAYIIKQAKKHQLKAIQLHGMEPPEQCAELKNLGYTIIKAFGIHSKTKPEEIEVYKGHCHYFLYDTKSKQHGGSGLKFNWDKLEELNDLGPFFLSGGIGAKDANQIKALDYSNLIGPDLNSRFEEYPGYKDKQQIEAFINEIRK